MAILRFNDGSLILEGGSTPSPHFRFHGGYYRARPIDYPGIIDWYRKNGIPLTDRADQSERIEIRSKVYYENRRYQHEAVLAWEKSAGRGCVVLPTGSGKTLVALRAIEQIRSSTLIVLPTIDLMNQWYGLLSQTYAVPIGILGGGFHEVRPLTVTTYDSAYRFIDLYGDRFSLLIFDEVHHLPSETYSHIAELSIAPFRLGLTATLKRTDGKESSLQELVGPVVYEKKIGDFKGSVLADYEVQRIWVDLTTEEKQAYDAAYREYIGYIRQKKISLYGKGWDAFILQSVESLEGRAALLAKQRASMIAAQASGKFGVLESLLMAHVNDRVLIFTRDVDVTYSIARRYLIPPITHHTNTKERKDILEKFRRGDYRFIVSSEALNEGVDVPAANVAIVLSGTASPVRHVQRLGRILRKKGDQKAMLYEVISRGTRESDISRRRRTDEAYNAHV